MTAQKLLDIIQLYRKKLGGYVPGPAPYPHDQLMRTEFEGLRHVWYCLDSIEQFLKEGRFEKAMRWFGFIQGVLWASRVFDINELKSHNTPDDPEGEVILSSIGYRKVDSPIDNAAGDGVTDDTAAVQAAIAPATPEPEQWSKWDSVGLFPIGTPVKIKRCEVYGMDGKFGIVESHIGDGYGVALNDSRLRVIFASDVEYGKPEEKR